MRIGAYQKCDWLRVNGFRGVEGKQLPSGPN